ncbi:MAG: S53 family peptidase [Thermomicrobiales bacterium]
MERHCLSAIRRYHRLSFVIVAVLAFAPIVGVPIPVGASAPVTAQVAIARNETKVGPTDARTRITLAVALAPLVSQRGMEDFLTGLSDPQSPSYQKYLTPKEFAMKFFDPAGRAEVTDFLKRNGLTVKDTGLGSIISATGTAAQVAQAFSVALNDYRDANGKTFYANDKTPALPTALAPRITALLGLDNAPKAHSHIAKPIPDAPGRQAVGQNTASACPGASNVITHSGGYAPNQFGTAFDFDTLYTVGFHGEGQTLALFELSDYPDSDVAAYKTCFGLNTTGVQRVNVDDGAADFSGQDEVNLDVDIMLGMLPKATGINIYVGPNSDQGIIDTYQQIATDNSASVTSTSWGLCEAFAGGTGPGTVLGAENTIFFQMAAQGQQIFAASGDNGSEDCAANGLTRLNTDDPASQPFMVGVGGTTVNINRTTNAYMNETVWNHGGDGGGGGLSTNWGQPNWQTGPGATNTYANGMREVPDIAAPADPNTGYVIYTGGAWALYGGTSGAAPLTAAGFALINQALLARVGYRLGFTNPSLYRILTAAPSAYHDVTVGNNCAQGPDCTTAGKVYPATAGYDLVTGVGTPKIGAIANYLAPPAPAPRPLPASRPGPAPNIGGGSTPSPAPPRSGGTAGATGVPAPIPTGR